METAIEEKSIEDNTLEGGEQAAGIQADAADNLEIGAQASMIQMVANDNEVEEVYSQELDFTNQPLEQNQQQTELDELRKDISKQSNASTTFQEIMSERIEKMNRAIAEQKQRLIDYQLEQAENSRIQQQQLIDYQQSMIDSERLLKERLKAIEEGAEKQKGMLKTVSDKVNNTSESMERRLTEVQKTVDTIAIDIAELKRLPTNVPTVPADDEQKPPISKQVAGMLKDVEERALRVTKEQISEIAQEFKSRMDHNNNDIAQKLEASWKEVSDKIDVVSRAVFNHGSQDQEETSITPDSEDVHELKGVEFVTQRVSGGVARGSVVGVSNAEARVRLKKERKAIHNYW